MAWSIDFLEKMHRRERMYSSDQHNFLERVLASGRCPGFLFMAFLAAVTCQIINLYDAKRNVPQS